MEQPRASTTATVATNVTMAADMPGSTSARMQWGDQGTTAVNPGRLHHTGALAESERMKPRSTNNRKQLHGHY